jgi:hypothetical protein
MVLQTTRRAGAAVALSFVLLTTGCAAASPDTPTLTETKGPTQLLRNEASSRIPSGSIDAISGEEDVSVSCKTKEEDPKGLYRSWQSSVLATIDADAAWRVAQIGTELSDSFIDDGWFVSGTKDGKDTTTLTKPGAVSTLAFTTTEADAAGVGATVLIDATGPCVLTEGPESNEVTRLEAAK